MAIFFIALSLIYISVCVGIYIGTNAAREKTRKINQQIIEEGEKAERECLTIAFLEAYVGQDLILDQLRARAGILNEKRLAKDAILQRRSKRTC